MLSVPLSPPAPSTVAVVGNGAAGTLVVVGLLREAARAGTALRITWIGDGPRGRGVAYATTAPWHRLNVPAAAMSLGEAARSFPDWLRAQGVDDDFAPRREFGGYLLDTLDRARRDAPGSVVLDEHHDRAVGLGPDGTRDGLRVELASGGTVDAGQVVLALGPFPGATPASVDDPAARARIVDDPWSGNLARIGDTDRVLLVGTGLTMVDVALSIARHRPRTRLLAVSRTGLVPRRHTGGEGRDTAAPPATRPGAGLDEALGDVGGEVGARAGRWREVVDGLRPVTQDLWRRWSRADQERFLTEHARRWEVHRHRMAPRVAEELEDLRCSGRLELATARLGALTPSGTRLRARLDAGDGSREVTVDRVVSCTGAQDDVTAVDDPLVAALLRHGLARPHPLGLGFDTDGHGAMRTATGVPGRVFGIGALRRGELYETTAIPEIREQAADLARLLVAGAGRPSRPASVPSPTAGRRT